MIHQAYFLLSAPFFYLYRENSETLSPVTKKTINNKCYGGWLGSNNSRNSEIVVKDKQFDSLFISLLGFTYGICLLS